MYLPIVTIMHTLVKQTKKKDHFTFWDFSEYSYGLTSTVGDCDFMDCIILYISNVCRFLFGSAQGITYLQETLVETNIFKC